MQGAKKVEKLFAETIRQRILPSEGKITTWNLKRISYNHYGKVTSVGHLQQ